MDQTIERVVRFLSERLLLSVIELGGYPDYSGLYRECGYTPIKVDSIRKARNAIKQNTPAVVVTEFNFQSDFRDRTSSMETLMASLQNSAVRPAVIVFYENQFSHQFEKVTRRFHIDYTMTFPLDADRLKQILLELKG